MRNLILIILIVAVLVLETRHFAGDTMVYVNLSNAASDSIQALRNGTVGRAESKAKTLKATAEDAGWNIASACVSGFQQVNQAILDTSITAAVKMKMASDDHVSATQVHVATSNGVVILTGVLEQQEQARRAEALAWEAEGVSGVVSRIQVFESSAKKEGGTRS